MAEYIENVAAQTSKLDWAFPFERKGQFPLDRSAIFSSLNDATKYATGDGSDERKLGGTSYVGQIISVYEAGEDGASAVVNAYIITPARGLMKLAATTASGDIAADVADLQGKVATLISDLDTLEAAVAAMYTNEQIDAFIEGAKDDRVDDLIEAVGKAAEGETAATGLYKLIADEAKARDDADKALDDKISAIDFVDEDKLATALEPYAKSADVEADIQEASNALTTEINKKVDAEAYAVDKKALQDEDAAIRAIAEGARDALNTFLTSEEVDTTVNTLKEIQAEIEKMTDATELATALATKADNTTVEGIDTRVKAIEEAPYVKKSELDAVDGKFASYTNTEALTTLLAGKQDTIPADTYDVYGAAATAKSEAIADAEGKIATAKQEAIDTAAETAQGKVNELAGGAVKANTDAIAAINNTETGILVQAKADATAKADAAKSGAEATAAELYATKEYVGIVPEGKGDTIVAYINKKAEETLAAAQGGSSETAASVAQALQNYKDLNDPKVAQNTTDIAGLRADLTTEAGKITNLQGIVEGHTGKITDLETLTSGHTASIDSHTQSITTLNGAVATKAEQTALDAAVADIAKNTGAIKTLNDTTIPAINEAIGTKANAADVYTKAQIGELAKDDEGKDKTIVQMIAEAQTAATYDDTVVKASIKANTDAIAILNGTVETAGSVAKVASDTAKAEVAAIVDSAPEAFDTLKEIATWIESDKTATEALVARVTANEKAVSETLPAAITQALADAKKYTDETMVKADGTTIVNDEGTFKVNQVTTDMLIQGTKILILHGGDAEISTTEEE